jgi:hypothetical protein
VTRSGARAVGIVLVAMTWTLLSARAAVAAPTGDGDLGPGYVRAAASDLGAGRFRGGTPARTPSPASPFEWERWSSTEVCVILPGPPPPELVSHVGTISGPTLVGDVAAGPSRPLVAPGVVSLDDPSLLPPGAVVVGSLGFDVGVQGARVLIVPRCVGPATPPLPVPPSPAEIWQETPLPRTAIHASPPGTSGWPGITRLSTLFWGADVPDTSARVSLRGFEVEVVARPIAYAWVFGNGETWVGDHPGSAVLPRPVTYSRRGDYDVSLYVVWEGRATMTFDGLLIAEEDLGTVTLPEDVPYHVAEIRAALRTTPGRSAR